MYLQISLLTNSENADIISQLLEANNAISITLLDNADVPLFETNLGQISLWPDTKLVALFKENVDTDAIITQLKQQNLINSDFISIENIAEKDWVNEWMSNYKPIQINEKLWICPSWQEIIDTNATNIIIDPGMAFGTGSHETTALCLNLLTEIDLTNKTMIDFGCGSGILAIAGLKFGLKKAIGLDIDEQALQTAQQNAQINAVADKIYLTKESLAEPCDLLIANILASTLKELAPIIINLVKHKGMLALSGILEEQAQSVIDAYKKDFDFQPIQVKNEWVLLVGIKKS